MEETLNKYKNVPVSVAAKLLDVSEGYIRVGLRDGRLPFGTAVQITEGGKWTFQISPGLLKEYITGSSLKNYFEENKEILKEILGE